MKYLVGLIAWALFAQVPAKVDFRRDVQTLLKANCIGCHGPSIQKNGFRLDRRRDAPGCGAARTTGRRPHLVFPFDHGDQ